MRALVIMLTLVSVAGCNRSDDPSPLASATTTAPTVTTKADTGTTTTIAPVLPTNVRGSRSVAVRARLATGETITFGLHPNAEPISVRGGGPALELCPGAGEGAPDSFGGWPIHAGFDACIPFASDGTVATPGVGSDAWHLSISLLATEPVTLDGLTLTYTAVDAYFATFSAMPMTLTITPEHATVVATNAASPDIRQRDRALAPVDVAESMVHGQAYGPVEPGVAVDITVTGDAIVEWN